MYLKYKYFVKIMKEIIKTTKIFISVITTDVRQEEPTGRDYFLLSSVYSVHGCLRHTSGNPA
jgi:hypothetical protein